MSKGREGFRWCDLCSDHVEQCLGDFDVGSGKEHISFDAALDPQCVVGVSLRPDIRYSI